MNVKEFIDTMDIGDKMYCVKDNNKVLSSENFYTEIKKIEKINGIYVLELI